MFVIPVKRTIFPNLEKGGYFIIFSYIFENILFKIRFYLVLVLSARVAEPILGLSRNTLFYMLVFMACANI